MIDTGTGPDNDYTFGSKNKYKNSKYLTQCTLKRELGSSSMVTTGWIPSDAAIIGKEVTLEMDDHKNVWTIQTVGTKMGAALIREKQSINRDYIARTDI